MAVLLLPVMGAGVGYSLRDSGSSNGTDWSFAATDHLADLRGTSESRDFRNRKSLDRNEVSQTTDSTQIPDYWSISGIMRGAETDNSFPDRKLHGNNGRELSSTSSAGSNPQVGETAQGARQEDQTMARRAIDAIPLRGMRVDAATPCAFRFYPELYPDKTLRFAVGSSEPVVVSVHGPGSGACRIDGQPMEDGRQYTLKDGMTLQSNVSVGVHLRPLKDAQLRLPNSSG